MTFARLPVGLAVITHLSRLRNQVIHELETLIDH